MHGKVAPGTGRAVRATFPGGGRSLLRARGARCTQCTMRSERRFPWQGLTRVPRADLAALRTAARALPPDAPASAARAVEELLGAAVSIAPLPIERVTTGELGRRLIEVAGGSGSSRLTRVGDEVEWRLEARFSSQSIGALDALADDFERLTVVLANGRFLAAKNFTLSQDGRVATIVAHEDALELGLKWTTR